MNTTLSFVRVLILSLSLFFSIVLMNSFWPNGWNIFHLGLSLGAGLLFGCALIILEKFFHRFNLRSFNIAVIGLFCGYLMAQGIMLGFWQIIDRGSTPISPQALHSIQTGVYLFSIYLAMVMVTRSSEEFTVSIPFIKFKPVSEKKKDILLDPSLLLDSRIIDIASSGLLDHHLVIPRFALKELYSHLESDDESTRTKAKRSLDVVKRLESLPALDFRHIDTDFPEVKDATEKLIRLAKFLDANIITADMNRVQQSSIESTEGIRFINIHMLSNAFKPISHTGENMNIVIRHNGKGAGQGVGYLEDGTMVVVNGGADHIGKTIRTQLVSVKHTTSGRMIFCNALDGLQNGNKEFQASSFTQEQGDEHKNYFAL